ncbi:MAG: DUF1629 domain-containing protein, partial [Terricaulis sp.]
VEPKIWPQIGDSRFKLLSQGSPVDAAVNGGDFFDAVGKVLHIGADYDVAIPNGVDTAVFRAAKKPRKLAGFTKHGHRFIVPDEVLSILTALDPEAIASQRLNFEFAGGEQPASPVHMINFIRIIDVVDFDRTHLMLVGNQGGVACRECGPIGVRADITADFHVFRDSSFPQNVFVSPEVIDALTRAKIKGWRVKDPADHYRLGEHLRTLKAAN